MRIPSDPDPQIRISVWIFFIYLCKLFVQYTELQQLYSMVPPFLAGSLAYVKFQFIVGINNVDPHYTEKHGNNENGL